ncbi:MAG: TIGR01777 family oxidoreductase [Bacteroidales bacterium]
MKQMKIAIAGYSGFIGSNFMKDHPEWEYIPLNRKLLYGEPMDLGKEIREATIVVNLAGYPINTRWTAANKRKIYMSRYGVNRNLVAAINSLEKKPEMFITASAIGIYGNEGVHDEKDCSRDRGFLATVIQQWEEPLGSLDHEVGNAILRFGVVLGKEAGAMVPFLKSTKFGIAPVMGPGKQILSFIHIRDLTAAMGTIIQRRLNGVFNVCAPYPADYRKFAEILVRKTGALFKVRVPVFLLRLALGEAHTMVTQGQHVIPARLLMEGYRFRYPDLEEALQNLLQEP